MEQGTPVKWVDGVGVEQKGTVDWEAVEWTANPVPIRDKDGDIRWIQRCKLELNKNEEITMELTDDLVEMFAKEYFHKIDCMPSEHWDRMPRRTKREHLEKMRHILEIATPFIQSNR